MVVVVGPVVLSSFVSSGRYQTVVLSVVLSLFLDLVEILV